MPLFITVFSPVEVVFIGVSIQHSLRIHDKNLVRSKKTGNNFCR